MKDGVRAVGVNMDFHSRLDEVRAQRAFGDLQFERPVGDAIVVSDLALLFNAQDLVEIDARMGVKAGPRRPAQPRNGRCGREDRRRGGRRWPPRPS